MPFYGYTPKAKSFEGIGTAATQLGVGIGAGVQQIEEKRKLAVEAAKDWKNMEDAVKGIRANYTKYGKTLVERGAISQEQFQAGLDQLSMPTSADQKNPEAYIIKMEERAKNAYKIFAGKEDLLLKTQAQGARLQQAQQVGQQATTEQRGLRTTGFQPAGERTETGFQKFEPKLEEQVTEPVPASREEATARFAAGAEGFQPTAAETTQFQKGVGQQFPPAEKPISQFDKDKFQLEKDKFAWKQKQDRMKESPDPKDYDKVLLDSIKNKFSAKRLSNNYTRLIKVMEESVRKAEGGVIEQITQQKLKEMGYLGDMTVPAIEEAIPILEKKQIEADKDINVFKEQIKEVIKVERPSQIGTYRTATEKVTGREALKTSGLLDQLADIRGFAYYSESEPLLSKTGEINISRPDVQDAVATAQGEGMSVDEIAKEIQKDPEGFINRRARKGGGGSTAQEMAFDADVLALGAKLRGQPGITEEEITEYMTIKQQQKGKIGGAQ